MPGSSLTSIGSASAEMELGTEQRPLGRRRAARLGRLRTSRDINDDIDPTLYCPAGHPGRPRAGCRSEHQRMADRLQIARQVNLTTGCSGTYSGAARFLTAGRACTHERRTSARNRLPAGAGPPAARRPVACCSTAASPTNMPWPSIAARQLLPMANCRQRLGELESLPRRDRSPCTAITAAAA